LKVAVVKEIEFRVPKQCDLADAEGLVERACAARGLIVGMKGALAGYPGCVHWHYKKPQQKGTLEITVYPKQRRIWAQVQDGRKAPWIDQELPRVRRAIEKQLRACAARSATEGADMSVQIRRRP
jgi:hypothetical protein